MPSSGLSGNPCIIYSCTVFEHVHIVWQLSGSCCQRKWRNAFNLRGRSRNRKLETETSLFFGGKTRICECFWDGGKKAPPNHEKSRRKPDWARSRWKRESLLPYRLVSKSVKQSVRQADRQTVARAAFSSDSCSHGICLPEPRLASARAGARTRDEFTVQEWDGAPSSPGISDVLPGSVLSFHSHYLFCRLAHYCRISLCKRRAVILILQGWRTSVASPPCQSSGGGGRGSFQPRCWERMWPYRRITANAIDGEGPGAQHEDPRRSVCAEGDMWKLWDESRLWRWARARLCSHTGLRMLGSRDTAVTSKSRLLKTLRGGSDNASPFV